jgi:hypothetical protein
LASYTKCDREEGSSHESGGSRREGVGHEQSHLSRILHHQHFSGEEDEEDLGDDTHFATPMAASVREQSFLSFRSAASGQEWIRSPEGGGPATHTATAHTPRTPRTPTAAGAELRHTQGTHMIEKASEKIEETSGLVEDWSLEDWSSATEVHARAAPFLARRMVVKKSVAHLEYGNKSEAQLHYRETYGTRPHLHYATATLPTATLPTAIPLVGSRQEEIKGGGVRWEGKGEVGRREGEVGRRVRVMPSVANVMHLESKDGVGDGMWGGRRCFLDQYRIAKPAGVAARGGRGGHATEEGSRGDEDEAADADAEDADAEDAAGAPVRFAWHLTGSEVRGVGRGKRGEAGGMGGSGVAYLSETSGSGAAAAPSVSLGHVTRRRSLDVGLFILRMCPQVLSF